MSDEAWTPLRLLAWTQGFFAKGGVDAPRLTAEILLAHALSCDRVRLYLDFDKPLGAPELAAYRALVRRRAAGEPTAWLTGRRAFLDHDFRVTPDVLVPRPETELVAEAAIAALPEGGALLDLCTGSGCIAVSAALARPGARVVATELSPAALAVARENAAALSAKVELLEGDLDAPVPAGEKFDVVVSNPPYVPRGEIETLSREVKREPRLALDGGVDGLDTLRRIVSCAPSRLRRDGLLLVEMHESHADSLPGLCLAADFASAEVRRDLAGLPRWVVARLSAPA
ncbi:MAG TPA: peptide chain release factor N(5)-glutamine methyltransferase [Anaeromyxobacteraceae bacterium]|nr:peptide chain release factor N(5)-glutamine methyltransferase [Anaeromyxobacteraceae bacterium]